MPLRSRLSWLVLLCASIFSGAAALALEVVWSKALVVPLGNSADSTALVLTGFMLGMAAGAWLGSWAAVRVRAVLVVYAVAELALALFAWWVPRVFAQLAEWAAPAWLQALPTASFAVRAALALVVIALPCLVMGATLPLLLAAPSKHHSRSHIGLLYGLNTCGATAAAAVTGFYGIAQWGIAGCSRRAAGCSVAAAALAALVHVFARKQLPGVARGPQPLRFDTDATESRATAVPGLVAVSELTLRFDPDATESRAAAVPESLPAARETESVSSQGAGRVPQRPERNGTADLATQDVAPETPVPESLLSARETEGVSSQRAGRVPQRPGESVAPVLPAAPHTGPEPAYDPESDSYDKGRHAFDPPAHSRVLATASHSKQTVRIALVVAFASGFALLGAEVIWARLLTFVFGHDTYAFATLLCVVLLGHTLGGLLYAALARYSPRVVTRWSLALTAAALLGCFYAACALVIRGGRDPFALGDRFLGSDLLALEILREWAFTPVLVLLPCLLSGVTYPATVALCTEAGVSSSLAMGRVGLTNGIGAALGATLTAFGLVPVLGLSAVLGTFALLLGLVVTALSLQGASRRKPRIGGGLVPLGVAVALLVAPRDLPKQMLHAVVGNRHHEFLFYQEARTATVSVIRNSINDERQLLVNAVNEVTTRLVHDQSFKLLGQLGPLLHPNPKRAVMICLGAGLAAGSALTHPLERLDVVDLLGAVQSGARYFEHENNHVLDDPRLHLHVNDGRQFLLTTPNRYDLAIVDSTHPKSVDSWILYTRQFFRLLHDRLEPGGIVVQWLPLHGLSEREFRSVVATFAAVFPQMTLWASVGFETYGQVGYAKLVGQRSASVPRIDCSRLQERLRSPRVQHDLVRYGMHELPDIVDQFIAGPERIRRWVTGVPIHEDDRPFLSYVTELSEGRAMTPDRLLAVRESPRAHLEHAPAAGSELDVRLGRAIVAAGLVIGGQLQAASTVDPTSDKLRLYREQAQTSLAYYRQLAERYPSDGERHFEAATQLMALGHVHEAARAYERALHVRPWSLRANLNRAVVLLESNQAARAADRIVQLLKERPRAPILQRNLAGALLAQGEPGAARGQVRAAVNTHPRDAQARLLLVDTEMALGAWSAAEQQLRVLQQELPFEAAVLERQARVLERQGDSVAAHRAWRAALDLDPYREEYLLQWARHLPASECSAAIGRLTEEPYRYWLSTTVRVARGLALACAQRWEEASQVFVDVLEADPGNGEAALGLGRALIELQRPSEATDALCVATRLAEHRASAIDELRRLGRGVERCAGDSSNPF